MTDAEKIANLRAALSEALSEVVNEAYRAGIEDHRRGTWWCAGMSDAEWLCNKLGLGFGQNPMNEVKARLAGLVAKLVDQAEATGSYG